MIETVAQLAALMLSINAWMPLFENGRTWAIPVKYTITEAQLLANKPACCQYKLAVGGQIMRINDYVWMVK